MPKATTSLNSGLLVSSGKIMLPCFSFVIAMGFTNKPELSEVVALGKSSSDTNYQFTVKIGDKVLFNKYAGSDFVINGEHFTIIKEIDILGIVER